MTHRLERRRCDRFTWERAVRAARELPWARRAVLLLIATYMDADGSNARPSIATLMAETGLSHGMLAGHLSAAEKAGWLDDSAGLRGGRHGAVGRSSERCATIPDSVHVESGGSPESAHVDSGPVDKGVSCSPESRSADSGPVDKGVPESTYADSGRSQSPFSTPPESTHVDTTNQLNQEIPAAAADGWLDEYDLPDELVVLRSKMLAFTALAALRWDRLTSQAADAIRELILIHGDKALIDRARKTTRADENPVFVQFYLRTWQAMPTPGQLLALVASRCTEVGHERQPADDCNLCRLDARVAAAAANAPTVTMRPRRRLA